MPMHRYAATTVVYLHAKNEIYNCSLQMLDLMKFISKRRVVKMNGIQQVSLLPVGNRLGVMGNPFGIAR